MPKFCASHSSQDLGQAWQERSEVELISLPRGFYMFFFDGFDMLYPFIVVRLVQGPGVSRCAFEGAILLKKSMRLLKVAGTFLYLQDAQSTDEHTCSLLDIVNQQLQKNAKHQASSKVQWTLIRQL